MTRCSATSLAACALALTLRVSVHQQLTLAAPTRHLPASRAATPLRAAGLLPPSIAAVGQEPAPALGATLPFHPRLLLCHGRAASRWSSLCPQLLVICRPSALAHTKSATHPLRRPRSGARRSPHHAPVPPFAGGLLWRPEPRARESTTARCNPTAARTLHDTSVTLAVARAAHPLAELVVLVCRWITKPPSPGGTPATSWITKAPSGGSRFGCR